MKKIFKKPILFLILIPLIIALGFLLYYILSSHNLKEIPNDYIAVFHGGVGEITYETYIYKIDNGHSNYGFKYINATSHTVSYGSPQWEQEITSKGKVTWTDDVFKIARDNGAYNYVRIPNDDKAYSIDEFQKIFIMD